MRVAQKDKPEITSLHLGSSADPSVSIVEVGAYEFRYEYAPWFLERLERLMRLCNDEIFHFDLSPSPLTSGGVLQYHGGSGTAPHQFDWHHDSTVTWGEGGTVAKVSAIVQLSPPEEHDGGRFEYIERGITGVDAIEQGSVIVLRGQLVHRVTPVTRGLRRSFVSILQGPQFQ